MKVSSKKVKRTEYLQKVIPKTTKNPEKIPDIEFFNYYINIYINIHIRNSINIENLMVFQQIICTFFLLFCKFQLFF